MMLPGLAKALPLFRTHRVVAFQENSNVAFHLISKHSYQKEIIMSVLQVRKLRPTDLPRSPAREWQSWDQAHLFLALKFTLHSLLHADLQEPLHSLITVILSRFESLAPGGRNFVFKKEDLALWTALIPDGWKVSKIISISLFPPNLYFFSFC